jgi:hypothetical protein
MKYAGQRHYSASRVGGIGFVALLHVGLIYILVNGLASKVIEVIRKPIETRIVEEVKPPAPKPAIILPPPPTFAPPPPFIPPPEVAVPVQAQQPVMAQRSATPQPQSAPMPAPVVAAAPAHTVHTEVGVVCPNSQQVRQQHYRGRAGGVRGGRTRKHAGRTGCEVGGSASGPGRSECSQAVQLCRARRGRPCTGTVLVQSELKATSSKAGGRPLPGL